MVLVDRLRLFPTEHPGQKTRELADALAADKTEVVACLEQHRGRTFVQDSRYRWRILELPSAGRRRTVPEAQSPTELSRLCRYYLECLSHDRELRLRVLSSSNDYAEL